MAKKLRDVVKTTGKPAWAQSKPTKETHASVKQKVDRGSEDDKNFSAEYVPTFQRSDHHFGYDAGTNDEPMNEQMEQGEKGYIGRVISAARRKKNEYKGKKAAKNAPKVETPATPQRRPKVKKVDPRQADLFKEDDMTNRLKSWQGNLRNKANDQTARGKTAKNGRSRHMLGVHANRNMSYAGQMAEAEALMAEGYTDEEIIAYFESKEE